MGGASPALLGGGEPPAIRNATSIAIERIRDAIIEGRLGPGERLKEETLARDLGLSRTPVREALLVLQGEGLVESSRNRGATVRTYTPDDIEEMYQLRAVLEGYAARLAAERIAPAQLSALGESCARFAELVLDGGVVELIRENAVFHNTILEATSSGRLVEMVRSVVEVPLVYRSFYWYSPEQRKMSERQHVQLLRALTARDQERAELLMKEHVYEARDFLISYVRDAHERGAPIRQHSA